MTLAAEVCNKIGDNRQLAEIYVHCKKWDEAFQLAERHPEYSAIVYRPYAVWLIENDRFEDAQEAFRKAEMPQEAIRVLQVLTRNSVLERRFSAAAYYFWHLSMGVLSELQQQQAEQGSVSSVTRRKFEAFQQTASLYYAYHFIHLFVEEPFTSHTEDSLFNMARYLVLHLGAEPLDGISRATVLYTLAAKARSLGAFKVARFAYQQLRKLRLPDNIREHVELGALTIQTKPFTDDESLVPICYRCSSPNPLVPEDQKAAAAGAPLACTQCHQPFVFSFYSFEVLPVVEFVVADGISDDEAQRLIKNDSMVSSSRGGGDARGSAQVLSLDGDGGDGDEDPFTAALTNFSGTAYEPVVADRAMLRAMPSSEVIVQRWPAPLHTRYFRNVMPDIAVAHCKSCNRLFDGDNYEAAVLKSHACPFCRAKVDINGDLIDPTQVGIVAGGHVGSSSA